MSKGNIVFLLFLVSIALCGCTQGRSTITEIADSDAGNTVLSGTDLSGGRQGQSVGFVDVDGDGIGDKVVGVPYAVTASGLGAAVVYNGDSTGGFPAPSMLLTGGDNFGFSFANAGDVDGDGKDDFAIGAIGGDGTDVSLSGSVNVYKGGSGGLLLTTLSGEGPMDKFGFSLAAGDLNGDGKGDLIVGAPFNTNSPALYQGGAVYVYFGPDLSARASLHASASNKGLGWAVASGAVDNDGFSDLLISASGKVLVYKGGFSFNPSIDAPDITIKSSATGFGKAIAVVGDMDGDGFGEIAIGAPNASVNSNRDTGSLYIVKGSASGTVDLGAAPAELIVRIDGAALFDRFGSSIVSVGDMDGDSKPDFAASAPMADVAPNDLSGRVYLFKGKEISPTATLANAASFNGMARNQGYGTSLALAKNNRLLVGGPRANADTGGVSMVDLSTGEVVPDGSSGGSTGDEGSCH